MVAETKLVTDSASMQRRSSVPIMHRPPLPTRDARRPLVPVVPDAGLVRLVCGTRNPLGPALLLSRLVKCPARAAFMTL